MSQYIELQKIADAVARDIQGDRPGENLDTNYDLWVEELETMEGKQTIGVIDMGDCWQCCFIWDKDANEWQDYHSLGDPYIVIERIIAVRDYRSSL